MIYDQFQGHKVYNRAETSNINFNEDDDDDYVDLGKPKNQPRMRKDSSYISEDDDDYGLQGTGISKQKSS